MKIAVHLGVKDEAEVIERCITHLRGIGVNCFVVCDMYSTDGTAEILERYRAEDFRIIKVSNAQAGDEWLRINEAAIRGIDADWLLFLDADEFPLPATGNLRDVLEGCRADILKMPRYNVPLGPQGPLMPAELTPSRYGDVSFIVSPIPEIRQHLRENPQVPWIRTVPVPKVVVRPQVIDKIIAGGHDIIPIGGVEPARATATGLLIAHLVLSTTSRFVRKIENLREYFRFQDASAGPNIAWHWRRWVELAEVQEIMREFDNSIFGPDVEETMRQQGIIRTAAEMLHLTQRP